MTIEEGLPIKRLRGDKILVRRYEYPTKTDSGLILPTSFTKQSEDVNQVHDLPKYQNSGEVIAIGDGVEEGVYELGDVVHFQPNYYQMAIFDKSDLALIMDKSPYVNNAEVLIDASNGVDWISKS